MSRTFALISWMFWKECDNLQYYPKIKGFDIETPGGMACYCAHMDLDPKSSVKIPKSSMHRFTKITSYRSLVIFSFVNIAQMRIKELLIKIDKKGYRFETSNKVRMLVQDMFNKFIIDHYAKENPAKEIRMSRDGDKEVRVLTPEEQTEFFDCCKGTFYDNLFTVAVSQK